MLECLKAEYKNDNMSKSVKAFYKAYPIPSSNFTELNIIDNNYSSEIKLEEIAKRLSLSTSTICHEFKKSEGVSIIEYKLKKQLEESYNLLSNSSMSVSEIAYLVGFNSVSYFNKQFKKEYNCTPLEYRNNK